MTSTGESMTPLPLLIQLLVSPGVAPECRPLATPERLPTVEELIDSTALATRMAVEPVPAVTEIQLGVAYPRTSGAPEAWVIDSADSPDWGSRLAGLVQAALRADGARPGTTLRIHLRATPPIEVRVQRSILCAPLPLDSKGSAQPAVQVTGGGRPAPPQHWNAVIRQRIGPDGVVLDARLQPGSGKPELDRLALLPVFARRWRPATLDGRPVEVWLVKNRADLTRP